MLGYQDVRGFRSSLEILAVVYNPFGFFERSFQLSGAVENKYFALSCMLFLTIAISQYLPHTIHLITSISQEVFLLWIRMEVTKIVIRGSSSSR